MPFRLRPILGFFFSAPLLFAAAPAAAQEEVQAPIATAPPTLKADTAIYHLDQGMLQYAFTLVNPSDTALFLDCQIPPKSFLAGNTLVLRFDRRAGSAGTAGGPAAGGAVNPEDFRPQRVAGGQTFRGQRRLDRLLGSREGRPAFSQVRLEMAYYPERSEGEGSPFVTEKEGIAIARPVRVMRRGKAPPPPRILRHRVPAPGSGPG